MLFDDENVEGISEDDLQRYFGDLSSPGSGYIFLYEANDFNATDLVSSMKLDAPVAKQNNIIPAVVVSPPTQQPYPAAEPVNEANGVMKEGIGKAESGWWPFGKSKDKDGKKNKKEKDAES